MLLWLGLETQTCRLKETTLKEENLSVQDITVTILALNGKQDTGHVINGVGLQR